MIARPLSWALTSFSVATHTRLPTVHASIQQLRMAFETSCGCSSCCSDRQFDRQQPESSWRITSRTVSICAQQQVESVEVRGGSEGRHSYGCRAEREGRVRATHIDFDQSIRHHISLRRVMHCRCSCTSRRVAAARRASRRGRARQKFTARVREASAAGSSSTASREAASREWRSRCHRSGQTLWVLNSSF